MTKTEAQSIAAGWISPSPRDANLTAFATGHPNWIASELVDEVERNIADVERNPQHYNDPAQCATELRDLLDWVIGR